MEWPHCYSPAVSHTEELLQNLFKLVNGGKVILKPWKVLRHRFLYFFSRKLLFQKLERLNKYLIHKCKISFFRWIKWFYSILDFSILTCASFQELTSPLSFYHWYYIYWYGQRWQESVSYLIPYVQKWSKIHLKNNFFEMLFKWIMLDWPERVKDHLQLPNWEKNYCFSYRCEKK